MVNMLTCRSRKQLITASEEEEECRCRSDHSTECRIQNAPLFLSMWSRQPNKKNACCRSSPNREHQDSNLSGRTQLISSQPP